MTSPLLPLVLLVGALDGALEVRGTLGVQGTLADAGSATAGDAQLMPAGRARLSFPTFEATVAYAPHLGLRYADGEASPSLYHRALLGVAFRPATSVRVALDAGAAYGVSDLFRVEDRLGDDGAIQAVPTSALIRHFGVQAGLSAEVTSGPRSRAHIHGWAFERGGLHAADQAAFPRERGAVAETRLLWDASSRDVHDVGLGAAISELAAGRTLGLATFFDRWAHRLSPVTEVWLEGGVGARAAFDGVAWGPATPLPIAGVGLRRSALATTARWQVSLGAELRPAINGATARVDEQAELRCTIAAAASGWTAEANASGALQLRPDGAGRIARVELLGTRRASPTWRALAGLWFVAQRDVAADMPDFIQWGVFVGGTGPAQEREPG